MEAGGAGGEKWEPLEPGTAGLGGAAVAFLSPFPKAS